MYFYIHIHMYNYNQLYIYIHIHIHICIFLQGLITQETKRNGNFGRGESVFRTPPDSTWFPLTRQVTGESRATRSEAVSGLASNKRIYFTAKTGDLSETICFNVSICFNMFQYVSICFNLFQSVSICFNVKH